MCVCLFVVFVVIWLIEFSVCAFAVHPLVSSRFSLLKFCFFNFMGTFVYAKMGHLHAVFQAFVLMEFFWHN